MRYLQSGGKYCYTNTMRNLLNTLSAKVNTIQETLLCSPSFSFMKRVTTSGKGKKVIFLCSMLCRIKDNTFCRNTLPQNLNIHKKKRRQNEKRTQWKIRELNRELEEWSEWILHNCTNNEQLNWDDEWNWWPKRGLDYE